MRFTQVDAFTAFPFAGNPAAVIPLDAWLPDVTLLAIAAENNLSETAFLVPSGDAAADFDLRWFTPTCEVRMCGHATLASGHILLTDDPSRDAVRFATRHAGILTVTRAGDGYTLDLPAIRVAPGANPALLAALRLTDAAIFTTVSGAEDTAIVLLPDAAAVRACAPDMLALTGIQVMAIVTAPGDDTDIVSRVFVPAWGIDEDPVTGSAHAALAPFWSERLDRTAFTAHQASTRGGDLHCRIAGDRVILTGRCVTVIEGVFLTS